MNSLYIMAKFGAQRHGHVASIPQSGAGNPLRVRIPAVGILAHSVVIFCGVKWRKKEQARCQSSPPWPNTRHATLDFFLLRLICFICQSRGFLGDEPL